MTILDEEPQTWCGSHNVFMASDEELRSHVEDSMGTCSIAQVFAAW